MTKRFKTWIEDGVEYTERPMTGILHSLSEEQKERLLKTPTIDSKATTSLTESVSE